MRAVPRRVALGGGVAALFHVASASSECLPVEPPAAAASELAATSEGLRVPAATIYLDVSGSMQGYVSPPRPPSPGRPAAAGEPRVYRDIVLGLPQLLLTLAEQTNVFAFGQTIRTVPGAGLAAAGRPEFYRDQSSRIQDALRQVEALPAGEIGIVVTDLFLSGEAILRGAELRAPLARILDGGRAIGLVGIRSGFAGLISDLPGARPYPDATERPFYLIVAGPHEAVVRLVRRLNAEFLAPVPPPADGGARHHAVIFSHAAGPSQPVQLVFGASDGATPVRDLLRDAGPAVGRFRFGPGGAGVLTAEVPTGRSAAAPVLLPDSWRITQAVWGEHRNGAAQACGQRWTRLESIEAPARLVDGQAGRPAIAIPGATFARSRPGQVFLLRIEVGSAGLGGEPSETRWTRAWSFDPRDTEGLISSKPRFFPTLNLREIAIMLEGLARERMPPRPLAGGLVCLQVAQR
jgi:hypothetical protein